MATTVLDMAGWSDDRIERGDTVPDGWYLADLTETDETEDGAAVLLTFQIAAGDYAGIEFVERLGDPSLSADKKKSMAMAGRIKLFASRLGLLPPEEERTASTVIVWDEAVGKRFAVQVQTRTFTKKDGTEGAACGLTFRGVFDASRPEVPEACIRGEPCPLDAPARGGARPDMDGDGGGGGPKPASPKPAGPAGPAGKPANTKPAGAGAGAGATKTAAAAKAKDWGV